MHACVVMQWLYPGRQVFPRRTGRVRKRSITAPNRGGSYCFTCATQPFLGEKRSCGQDVNASCHVPYIN